MVAAPYSSGSTKTMSLNPEQLQYAAGPDRSQEKEILNYTV